MKPSCSFKSCLVVGLFTVPVIVTLNSPAVDSLVVESGVPDDFCDDGVSCGGIINSVGIFEQGDFVSVIYTVFKFLR